MTPRERAPGTRLLGGWMGPKADLDMVTKIISSFPLPVIKSQSFRTRTSHYIDWATLAPWLFVINLPLSFTYKIVSCMYRECGISNSGPAKLSGEGCKPAINLMAIFCSINCHFVYFLALCPNTGDTQPLVQWVLGSFFPDIKWPGYEAYNFI